MWKNLYAASGNIIPFFFLLILNMTVTKPKIMFEQLYYKIKRYLFFVNLTTIFQRTANPSHHRRTYSYWWGKNDVGEPICPIFFCVPVGIHCIWMYAGAPLCIWCGWDPQACFNFCCVSLFCLIWEGLKWWLSFSSSYTPGVCVKQPPWRASTAA